MNQDVKIIDCYTQDNNQLLTLLAEGWSIQHAISYEQPYFNQYQHYDSSGNSRTKYELQSTSPMIKYILYRDGIAKNVYG